MRTLHLVSHTHWDREWYLTFQQFRLKLVHLIDGLLDLLDADPDYKYFMLDGQTIVLDDYLFMRPGGADVTRPPRPPTGGALSPKFAACATRLPRTPPSRISSSCTAPTTWSLRPTPPWRWPTRMAV